MAELDLTAERAKRTREDKTLVMRDDDGAILDKFDLVPEFPALAMDLGAEGKIGAALQQLFQDSTEAERFVQKYKPSVDDLLTIMRLSYGLGDPTKASASGG